MSLALRDRPAHAAIEGIDGGVEDATRRVKMVWAEGIRVSRQPRAREREAVGRCRPTEPGGDLVRLDRLVIAVSARRSGEGPAWRRRARVRPRTTEEQE